jgi:molecular chaperone DnaK (HSP70)
MTRYLIGIDLGTTNSAVSYIDLNQAKSGSPRIQTYPIPQLVAPAEMGQNSLLPSFLYLPGEHDLPHGATALPWDPDIPYAVGEFARNHGSKIPGRLATSAKSWLCHAGVDRSSPLLPWSAPPEVERISPVEASARYLQHMVKSWNHVMAAKSEANRMEKQSIVLTVPASFDDVARNLTLEAAQKAGLEKVILLEEPQAAFYCWLATHSAQEATSLKPGWYCLVVDVGGGTTDFSLIQSGELQGELTFTRQAVGDHLLLGGDNMDLALAKFVEGKLPQAGKLDAVQYGLLTQACRQAKEHLLAPNPPESEPVTIMGRGRKVVGGSLHTTLTPEEVRQVILEGFFPVVPRDAEPQRSSRIGLHEMGLPYVSDAGITRHLSSFLKRHSTSQTESLLPQAILFNGGVFQPEILRNRVLDVLGQWYATPGQSWSPLVLTNPSLDLAVAMGATYYAWLRHSGGKRIGGGIPRSYYLAVDASSDSADGKTVLCVVPQHLEEGEEISLPKPELELSLGQPVMFPLFTSTVRGDDKAGDVLQVKQEQLLTLPPLHTILRGGKRSTGAKQVPVTLAARCTEIGTVELWCVTKDQNNRWRLEFNVRDIVKETAPRPAAEEEKTGVLDVWPEDQVQQAAALIRGTFGGCEPEPKELTKALEQSLDASRDKWPTGLCRRLLDFLYEAADERKRSPQHLGRWQNLVGYCLRPGFGDSLDKFRVEQLWKMIHAPQKSSSKISDSGADLWIMWRRVAGGLSLNLQNTLFNRLRPVLLAAKGKNAPKPSANELAEMWRAAASLERLDVKIKQQLGETLLKQLRRTPTPNYGFPSLTRLGARVLPYGPLNAVVHPSIAQNWLDAILGFEPGHQSEKTMWAWCLVQLSRRSGQRALDVDDSHRRSVLTVLHGLDGIPPRWARMVEEVTELESDEQGQMFGESLPIGLRLVKAEEEQAE